MFAPRQVAGSVATLALAIAGCSAGKAGVAPARPAPQSVTVGSGILAPNRIVPSPGGQVLYVATGQGESFPEGYLHALEAATLRPLPLPPLEVGRNVSDMINMGGWLLVASRADRTIALVDPASWHVLDRIALGFPPIALSQVNGTDAVVASLDSSALAVVSTAGGRLAVLRRAPEPERAGAMAFDPASDTAYIAVPDIGIVAYDGATLAKVRTLAIPALDPGKGMILWRGFLALASRDGYVDLVDRQTGATTAVDLAPFLGLVRAALPARAIDSNHLVDLGGDRIAVINDRQDSLVLGMDAAGTSATPLGRMPAGAFGTDLARGDEIAITAPASNAIHLVALHRAAPGTGQLPGRRRQLGTGIAATLLLPGAAPAIAALDSSGAIHVFHRGSGMDEVMPSEAGKRRMPLLAAGPGGTVATIEHDETTGANQVVVLGPAGARLETYPVAIEEPSALAFQGNSLAVLSRLRHSIAIFDRSTGTARVVVLGHDRPRLVVPAGGNDWLVFHDTNPSIGITRIQDGTETAFTPLEDWVSSAASMPGGGIVAAAFDGAMLSLAPDGTVTATRRDPAMHGLTDVEPDGSGSAWITSSDQGVAYHLDPATLAPLSTYARYGLLALGTVDAQGDVGVATTRTLEFNPRPAQ